MNSENLGNNETMLQMSPWDFDQSPNGWRKFEATKEHVRAANVIREYITKNKDRIINLREGEKTVSLELMHFHVGQLLASEGKGRWPEAINAFNQSFQEGRECWNAYVSATIGFLENDMKRIEDAISTIEVSQEADKRNGNLGIVKNFKKALEMGERDYEKPYLWPRD